MLQQSWQVDEAQGKCAATGRKIEEGQEFYTVLFEDGESFRRVDYSLESWQGIPQGAFCHFRTRMPIKDKRKKLFVDDDLLIDFFLRLEAETEPVRVQFRFMLALILMRKRRLRYAGTMMLGGAEVWEVALPRDATTHRVVNPRLADAEIEGVSGQLSAILHGDMGQWSSGRIEDQTTSTEI